MVVGDLVVVFFDEDVVGFDDVFCFVVVEVDGFDVF